MMSTSPKPCRYVAGTCPRGDTCMFAHARHGNLRSEGRIKHTLSTPSAHPRAKTTTQETIGPSDNRVMPMCSYFATASCIYGDSCHYRHTNAAVTTPQETRTCKFYTIGNCKFGDRCLFIHDGNNGSPKLTASGQKGKSAAPSDEVQSVPATVPVSKVKIKLENEQKSPERDEKCMVGSTRAIFGPGAEVLELVTVEQTRRIVIENLHDSLTGEMIKKSLEFRFGDVVEVIVKQNRDDITAVVTMPTAQKADEVIGFIRLATPEGFKPAPHKYLTAYGVPETYNQQGAHLSTTIEVSGHYPSRIAYAHYPTAYKAKSMADRKHGVKFKGRRLQCKFEAPTHYRRTTIFSVVITNLPERVNDSELKNEMEADRIILQPLKYTVVGFEHTMRTVLGSCGQLISFEPSPIQAGASKIFAFARFAMAKESLYAVAQFHCKKIDLLGDAPVYLQVISSIKYSVHAKFWGVLGPEVAKCLEKCNAQQGSRYSAVHFNIYESSDINQHIRKFRIYGKDVKALGAAKTEVDKVIKGEVLESESGAIWDLEFDGPNGIQYLESLMVGKLCVVAADSRLKKITLYGEPAARAQVKAAILDHTKSLAMLRHSVRLSRDHLTALICGGFQTLRERLGDGNVRLDVVTRMLEVKGSEKEVSEILDLLTLDSVPRIRQVSSGDRLIDDCPICYCEIEGPVDLGCGHSYCSGCYELCIESTIRNKSIPVSCVTCETKVGLRVLRQLKDYERLLEASFSAYISSNASSYAYCPTPDCSQVYRIGPTGAIVQCSECLANICTFCKIESHDGVSCEEIQEHKDPHTAMNERYMREQGIQSCPNCRTKIFKSEGCNHITCRGCRTHFCWACLKDFGVSGSGIIYEHMSTAHGGIGI